MGVRVPVARFSDQVAWGITGQQHDQELELDADNPRAVAAPQKTTAGRDPTRAPCSSLSTGDPAKFKGSSVGWRLGGLASRNPRVQKSRRNGRLGITGATAGPEAANSDNDSPSAKPRLACGFADLQRSSIVVGWVSGSGPRQSTTVRRSAGFGYAPLRDAVLVLRRSLRILRRAFCVSVPRRIGREVVTVRRRVMNERIGEQPAADAGLRGLRHPNR